MKALLVIPLVVVLATLARLVEAQPFVLPPLSSLPAGAGSGSGSSAPVPPPPADPSSVAPGNVAPDDVAPDDLAPGDVDPRGENDAPKTPASTASPTTGTVRGGVYHDSDNTTVWRTLGELAQAWGRWSLSGTVGIDAVSSASVDVRSSPALGKVDVMTTASGRSSTSGGEMTDTRYEGIVGGSWNDTSGHIASVTGAVATERDYASISGGLNGSYDLFDRTTTLLGGFTLTDNWVSSVLDSTLHKKMFSAGWSAGIAHVLTRDDVLRFRYDGKLSDGYQASPYRNVRFGNWTASIGSQQIVFMNTLGSADGLPELLPELRLSHAGVVEWMHSLVTGIGLHSELRLAHDSWGIDSLGAALDLRIARPGWRLQTGYRFYTQSRADFFESKYTQSPSMYTSYTSDKELGDETGHLLRLNMSFVVMDADGPNDRRVLFNMQVDAAHYSYPGFVLLSSRDSVFALIGFSWEQ